MLDVNFNAQVYHEKNVANTKYSFMLGLVADILSVKSPPEKVKKAHIEIKNQYTLVQRVTLSTYLSKITISG